MAGSAWATATRRSEPSGSDNVHGAPIGKGRHGQACHLLQGAAVVHEGGERRAGVGEEAGRLLGPLALRDVPEVGGEQGWPFGGNPGDRQLHRELRAARPQRRHFDPLVEDRPFAGGEVVGQAPVVPLPQGRRDDQFGHLPSQHVGPPIAEHPLSSRIELHDLAPVVDGDDGIEGRLQDRRLASLALPKSELGLALLRHVTKDEDHADRLALLAPDGGGTVVNGPFSPVPGDQHSMVAQPNDDPLPNDFRHRVLDRPAGLLRARWGRRPPAVAPCASFLAPAGQGLGHRVEERHSACDVGLMTASPMLASVTRSRSRSLCRAAVRCLRAVVPVRR